MIKKGFSDITSLGLLLIAISLVYSNHFHNPFHFDDFHTISNNNYIRDLKNIPLFFKDGSTISSNPINQSYRPLTCVSYAIDYKLGGGTGDTFYFQLSTFIWYLVQIVLMFFLFRFIFRMAGETAWASKAALLGVAWFGLHTSSAETINYICARTDSLSTLAVVAGFALYIFRPGWRKFYLYLIPPALGVLVKQSALVFAPLLACYVFLFEKNASISSLLKPFGRKAARETILQTLPAFLFAFFLYWLVVAMTPDSFRPGLVSRFHYMITQPFVSLHYFKTFFLPTDLSADSDWLPLEGMADWRFFTGIAFLLVLLRIAAGASENKNTKPIAFGIFWFFLALLPSSSIVAFAEVMNDHRIFFPFIGLAMATTWTIALILYKFRDKIFSNPGNRFYVFAGIAIVLGANAMGTWERNKVWSSEESLWYDVTVKSPANGRGLMNYGLVLMGRGDYPGAEEYFLKALKHIPNYSYLQVNMGVLRNAQGKTAEAEQHFKRALEIAPDSPEPHYYYGNWLKRQGRQAEALHFVERGLQISPGHGFLNILFNELKAEGAVPGFSPVQAAEELVKKEPTALNFLNLSLAYFRDKQFEKCAEACNRALAIQPVFPEAYNNICSAYNELQKWKEAKIACEKAIEQNPDFQLAKNNLRHTLQNLGK